MNTIYLHKFAPAIVMNDMDILNKDIDELVRLGSPFVLDFDGIKGIEMEAAAVLSEKLRNKYGLNYRQQVKFVNMTPLVRNAFLFSEPVNELSAKPSIPTRHFSSAFSRVFAAILLFLTLGVGQMWADNGWYSEGTWQIWVWPGTGSDTWKGPYNKESNADWGVIETDSYYIKGVGVNTWGSGVSSTEFYFSLNGTTYGGTIGTGSSNGNYYWENKSQPNPNVDIIANAANNPGNNTITCYFKYNGSNQFESNITYTIPGFTSLSTTSVTFDNTTVDSNSSKSITYTHYGTAPTNIAARYSITGTDADQFSITALSETGATIQFAPTSAGTKTATLVINDVHGKETSEITLTGKTQYIVSYNKGSYGTGSNTTANKVYGTNLTLLGETFTRTGYTQTAWNTGADGTSGTSYALNGTYSTEEALTLYPTWTPKTYTITLSGNGGTGGSATATYNSSTLTGKTDASYAGHSLTGYFTATSDGTKVINADGTLVASVSGYTNASSQWIKDDNVTLYAQWVENATYYDVTFAVGTGYTSMGSLSAAAGSAITSGDDILSGTSVTFTASPNTGYRVAGFYSDAACTSSLQSGSSTTYTTSLSGNTTVYVKFEICTATITLDRNGGTAGSESVTATYGSTLPAFTAHTRTGYTLTGYWSATSSGTKYINADGSLVASTTYANSSSQWISEGTAVTFHAQWTENMTTVTINSSPTGVGAFTLDAAAFTAGNTTTAGVATSHTVVATAANSDYAFSSWTAAGNATGSNSTNTYTLYGNGSGSTGTLTANFTLVPCTLWYHTSSATFADKTGQIIMSYDLEEDAYYADVDATPSSPYYFRFYHNETTQYSAAWDGSYPTVQTAVANGSKITCEDVNEWGSKSSIKYVGVSGSQIRIWFDYQNKKTWITTTDSQWAVSGGDSGNADGSDAMGDWSANANKMNESATNTVSTTINITSSGDYYLKVTDRYTNTWYGKNSTTITRASNSASGLISGGANITFTADVTGTYTFAYNTSTQTLTVTYPTETGYTVTTSASAGGSVDAASYTAYEFTTTAISATPNTGYYFTGWEATRVSVTFANASSASTTINGVTAAATIKANFAPKWAIAGGDSQNADNGDDVMGNWSTTTNLIANIGTNANSQDTGYVEIDLPANTTFYFKVKDRTQDSDHGWYGNNGTMNYANNNKQAWDMSTEVNNNCGITTAGAGTYKFAWNFTINKVTVHYPNSYTVTFGYGTGGSEVTATGSVSGSITTGQYVAEGEDITFTQTPETGYTFKGWYTTSDGNTTVTGMGVSDPVLDDIAANATVYAQYTENMHTVTVLAGTHGTITTPIGGSGETVSAGIATSAAIVAEVADYGYYFQGWTVESGTATIADASALSTTVTATSDATIKANFVSHWTIAGGDTESANGSDAMGDWSTVANGIDNFTEVEDDVWEGYAEIDLPANTTFYFKVRDLYDGEAWYGHTGEMTYTNYENWSMTKNTANCRITTAGKGTYRFTWNEKDETLTVTYPTSYTVAYSVYTFLGDDESNSESTTGGSITSVVDGDDIAFTSGKYIVNGGTAVFTHSTPTTNYHFDGWYSDAACETAYVDGEGGAAIDDEDGTLTLTISANKTVYAKFAENMTTVTLASTAGGHIEIGGAPVTSTTAGVYTTRSLTPVANTGYYFAGWTKTACTDYSISGAENSEDNTTITLTGGGLGETTGQTLTANFVELEKVYFRNWNADANEPLWDNVYVYFSISYDGNYAKSNGSSEYSGILMTREGTSNVYWAYVPRGTTRYNYADDTNNANSNNDIAFSNHNFGTNNGNGYTFYEYEAVMRGDYKTEWNMFVPQHGNFTDQNTNSTKYYNGYWKHHNVAVGTDAGYRIERYNGSGYETPADNGGDRLKFLVTSENTIQYQLRVDNLTNGRNNYMIYNVGGTHYITFGENVEEAGYTITNTDCSNIGLSEYNDGSPRFYITPTSEGIYTLTIDMSGDVMRLSVNYPVAVGDYMLVHSYNNGSAKTHYSDIIKSTEVGERHYSMYIDNVSAHSPSLVLKKCTSISAGNPVWSAGNAVSMTGFGTAGGFEADTMGVFVFDVAINNDAATLSYIEPYRGSYYIKTDCADGGWTAYKNNVMDLNTITFDTSDPQAYDYLYCKWVDNTAAGKNVNVKCVIANDYCIAVSDTLTDDNILGTDVQTLPYNANVRFSYNSTSNQLKRAYINGSSTATDRYLVMVGDDKLFNRDGSDINWDGLNANEVTFTDRNNWIYIVNLQAQSGAEVYITANYNGQVQNLVGSATAKQTVLTTTAGGATKYNICAVYDFKTNKLVTAWRPGGAISEELNIETDVMIMRTDNTETEEITFGAGGSIPDKKTVYALIEFDKATLTASTSRTQRSIYWIGFPFDVRLSDAFGFGIYGKHWIMQYYDGAERAAKGQWADSPTRWKYITPAMREEGYVLKANVGYVLKLDLDELGSESKVWDNSVTLLDIYFPSKEKVAIDDDLPTSMEVPAHPCSITRDRRDIWDSNWNLIAVPSFANVHGLNKVTPTVPQGVEIDNGSSPNALSFYYNYDGSTNSFGVADAKLTTFNTMFAYMVQYAGTLDWSVRPSSMPAARRADSETEKGSYTLDLHVSQAGNAADHTFVRLQDNATESYDLNIDLVKAENAGMTNLYTIVEGVSMGANCLPVPATTTTVPVGIDAAAAAEYTFSLPEGTDGMNVSLIDYETGITTNLALGDYTIALGKGTYKERFALVINRRQVTTDIEAAEGDMLTTGCEKVIIDGMLYLRKDGRVYDAQGKLVR